MAGKKLTLKGNTVVKIELDKEYSHILDGVEQPDIPVTIVIDTIDAINLGFSKNWIGAFNEKGMDGREIPLSVLTTCANEQGVRDFCYETFIDRYFALENLLNEFVVLGDGLLNEKGLPRTCGDEATDEPVVHPAMMKAIKECQDTLQNAHFTNGLDSMGKGHVSPFADESETDGPNRPRPRPKRRTVNHLKAVDPIN